MTSAAMGAVVRRIIAAVHKGNGHTLSECVGKVLPDTGAITWLFLRRDPCPEAQGEFVYAFEDIQVACKLQGSGAGNGKIVVEVT